MSDYGHFTPRPCQNCKDKDAEIERLTHVHKRDLAEYNRVAKKNTKLRALMEEGVRRVRLLLEIQEIVDNGPITERASRRWVAEALAALKEADDE